MRLRSLEQICVLVEKEQRHTKAAQVRVQIKQRGHEALSRLTCVFYLFIYLYSRVVNIMRVRHRDELSALRMLRLKYFVEMDVSSQKLFAKQQKVSNEEQFVPCFHFLSKATPFCLQTSSILCKFTA